MNLSLSVEDASARVHFTLDGSLPNASSAVYTQPLELRDSARVRALAIAPSTSATTAASGGRGGVGGASANGASGSGGTSDEVPRHGPIATETYLRVAAEAASFTSHLPLIVIDTFEAGALNPQGESYVPASLQVFEPSEAKGSWVGPASFDTRIGIHVRGESSREFAKKQYAVELWQDALNEDEDKPLLGMPAGSDWVLSDAVKMDRSLIRNALVYELSNRIGRYAPRTRFVEVFLVDRVGELRSENYLGFFSVIEKIKRGVGRLDLAKLSPNDLSGSDVTGGFILRIDKGTSDFQAAGKGVQFAYPDSDSMRLPERKPQVDYIRAFIEGFGQAANAADFEHPVTSEHYSELIDVDAWIDHNIINALTKNVDGLRISAYFHKDREGRLAAGPVWDFDRSLGTPYDERARDPEEWRRASSDAVDYFQEGWWRALFRDPVFKAKYRQRFLQLLEGEFSPDNLDRIIDGLASAVGAAAARNFERWTDTPPRNGMHAAEIALLKDFLRRRGNWIKVQLNAGF
jgi:hypothetical protein